MKNETVGSYIVKARVDGRGGARVFGLSPELTKKFIGKSFTLGNKSYKVTTDGRINIPKAVMNKYGILGTDGRRRVSITWTSQWNRKKEVTYAGFINKPLAKDKNRSPNWRITKPRKITKRGLKPADGVDYNWSHT